MVLWCFMIGIVYPIVYQASWWVDIENQTQQAASFLGAAKWLST